MRGLLLLLVCSCFGFTVDMDAATDGVPAVLLRFSNVPVGFVLAWNSPLHAAFHSHWLRVVDTETGAELPFVGPRARFTGRPSVDAYVPLPDEVAVSFKRDYELVRGRSYRLSFRGSFLDFVPVKDANRTAADFVPLAPTAVSAPIVWRYNPRVGEPNVIVPAASPSSVKGLRFKQCDSEQVTASKAGWGEAVAQIAAGQTHLQTGGPGSALYVTWFGSGKQYESRVSNVILSTHRWITDYDNATVDCKGADCEDDVYAYVFPNDKSETVYLCGAYWSSVLVEQGNTFVHELAHFQYVGNTDDFAYGQSACKRLAKSKPAQATDNSDNYSYFCEQANGGSK